MLGLMVNIISGGILAVFLFAYYMKLWLLKRRFGIKGEVFAKGQKNLKAFLIEIILKAASFIAFAVWALSAVLFQKPIPGFEPIFISNALSYIGLFLSGLGVLLFILAMVQMKNSWRAGIDKETKTELVTNGVYKISRNPAFVGMDIMLIGAVFTFGNLILLVFAALLAIILHLQILQEEKHLKQSMGQAYEAYMRTKPRYILFL